ncbi:MAG: nitrate/nitrite transporter NrtS [Pseudanabaenaceae cyanobacterium bins.39]|nr:nitrate/nitrite transporter NrtS [Pseudanabaenaceae cyanobacterium bins.39]
MKIKQVKQIAKSVNRFGASLVNPQFALTGFKVALMVGSILFFLNHGVALSQGRMNQERWISAILTYFVPYMVSIHGQQSGQSRSSSPKQKR